ncbi:MAG: hypothetical protein JWQ35_1210 [Bacteriovoracaceae bacterium]|nr:hypothetical protein [Bacteriovoracaceae bacterium]
MHPRLKWSFFGSSLVSAYWNGAATYYRGMIRELSKLGHDITFYEPNAYDRQKNRDISDPSWAEVEVYEPNFDSLYQMLEKAKGSDVIVKASGVGVFDEELEKSIIEQKHSSSTSIFWDVDAPATLDRLTENLEDPFHSLIPQFDFIFTYGGGPPVVKKYSSFGARECTPIYNALDPQTHFPVFPETRFSGTIGFLGNRLPDREERVENLFFESARRLSDKDFVLGGSGWADKSIPENLRYLGHVYTHEHNAFNSSLLSVLNISRDSMARYGFSPATRIFEAAGAGACILTDSWDGIENFLEPGREILVVKNAGEIVEILDSLSTAKAKKIGEAAFKRINSEHTYSKRAKEVDSILRNT